MGWVRETLDGHPMVWHNGGVIGANVRNAYFPDQRIAVVVFANTIGFDETGIVREAFRALVPPSAAQLTAERDAAAAAAPGEDPAISAAAKAEYERWRAGTIDRSRYDATMRGALTDATVQQVTGLLAALGPPTTFIFKEKQSLSGGAATSYVYRAVTAGGAVQLVYSLDPDGLIGGIFFKLLP